MFKYASAMMLGLFVLLTGLVTAGESKEEVIQSEIKRLKNMIESHGGYDAINEKLEPLREAFNEAAKEQEEPRYVAFGEHRFQLFITRTTIAKEWDLASMEHREGNTDAVEAIVSFDKKLKEMGVDLFVCPVPGRIEAYADQVYDGLPEGFPVSPARTATMIKLLEAGVEVVDILPALMAERKKTDTVVYEMHGHHPSGLGAKVSAELVASRMERISFPERDKNRYKVDERMGVERVDRGFAQKVWNVLNADGTPFEQEADGPIVVMGDSHALAYKTASWACNIARATGVPVNDQSTSSGGATAHQRLARTGKASIKKRKAVVWIVTGAALGRPNWPDPEFSEEMSLAGLIMMGRPEEALKQYKESVAKGQPVETIPEGELNMMGYNLAGGGKLDEAKAAFELNILMHPDDANPYDSMGEFYARRTDNKEKAIEYFKLALTKNPSPQLRAGSERWLQRLGVDTVANRPTLSTEAMDALVGTYDVDGMTLKVFREGEKLIAHPSNQPKMDMLPLSETKFDAKGAKLNFENSDDGMTLTVNLGNRSLTGKRITKEVDMGSGSGSK